MEGEQARLVRVSVCLCALRSSQRVSWLGFAFHPAFCAFWAFPGSMAAAIQGRGPAQGEADGTSCAPGGTRAQEPHCSQATDCGPALRRCPSRAPRPPQTQWPLQPPPVCGAWQASEITWPQSRRKLRSQVGNSKQTSRGLDAEKAGVPRSPGSSGDTRGGDTWGDTQCLQGDTQGPFEACRGDIQGAYGG